ncbi:MAG: phosphoenolpyruvate carboxykinase (GTP) [Thermoplasmataceae archaeon]
MLSFEVSDISGNKIQGLTNDLINNESIKRISSVDKALSERITSYIANYMAITEADSVEFVTGKEDQIKRFESLLLNDKTLIKLNTDYYKNSFLYRSSPSDVARSEKDTIICTNGGQQDVGPTNNWMKSEEALKNIMSLFKGSMKGRKLYVVPYWLGPFGSEFSKGGIELTDSLYVVLNLAIITRAGNSSIDEIAKSGKCVIGLHAMGNLDPEKRYIMHFPEENNGEGLIASINTNYGGNALLSKKCHALRIASFESRSNGWLAEHMMLIGVKSPDGEITYITGAFPSSSGKTNLAMLEPPEEYRNSGWSTYLVSDDITWMNQVKGRLNGINPENGFFGVIPHTSEHTNPNAIKAMKENTIFTNVGVDQDLIPFWEGKCDPPKHLIDWKGRPWDGKEPVAHPNSRFTTPIKQYPRLSDKFESPEGVPISAFLYGGRRSDLLPLVYQSYDWEDGVLIGAMQRVETTAASTGKVGVLRNDPMAMRPFMAYNMADYFRYHLSFKEKVSKLPLVFNVNWFRKNEDGKFIWPGYTYNMHVVEWILGRTKNKISRVKKTPIGYVPDLSEFNSGNKITLDNIKKILEVDSKGFLAELEAVKPFFDSFGDRFPEELWNRFYNLRSRLEADLR